MKAKLRLKVVGLIGGLAFISAAYCFWLMTVPLSYNLVYVVVIGFIASAGILVAALITFFVLVVRLRRSMTRRENQPTRLVS